MPFESAYARYMNGTGPDHRLPPGKMTVKMMVIGEGVTVQLFSFIASTA